MTLILREVQPTENSGGAFANGRPRDHASQLDRVMEDEFDVKMLGRVGRGHLTEVKFLKRTLTAVA